MDSKSRLFYMVAFGLIFLFEFGTISLLSFRLDVPEYNVYQKIINILPFAMSIISLGAPFSIVYFTSSGYQNKKYLYDANLASAYAFLACLLPVLLMVFFVPDIFYLVMATILGFFGAVKQNTISYFLGKKDLILASKIRVYQRFFALFPVVLAALLFPGLDIFYLFVLLFLGEVLGFAILQAKYTVMSRETKVRYFKRFRVTSYYSFLTNSISMFMAAAPFLVLSYFSSDPKVEIEFGIAIMMIRYTTLMLGPFMQLIVPSVAGMKKERDKVSLWFRKNAPIVVFVGVSLCIMMYFFGGLATSLLFSKKYSDVVILVEILSLLLPFLVLNSFLAATLSALGKVKTVFRITLVTSILLVVVTCLVMVLTNDIKMFSFSIIFSYMVGTVFYIRGYLTS